MLQASWSQAFPPKASSARPSSPGREEGLRTGAAQPGRFAPARGRSGPADALAGAASPLDVVAKAVQALEEVDERRRQVEEEAREALALAEHRVEAAEARAAALEAQLRAAEARAAEAEHALWAAGSAAREGARSPDGGPSPRAGHPYPEGTGWATVPGPELGKLRGGALGWVTDPAPEIGQSRDGTGWATDPVPAIGQPRDRTGWATDPGSGMGPLRDGTGWATDLNTALLVLLLGLLLLGPDGLVRWLQNGLMALTGFVLLGTVGWALCGSWARLARAVERAVGAPALAPLFARLGPGSPDRQARAAARAGRSLVRAVQFGLLLQGFVLAILYGLPAIRSAGIL